MTKSIEKRRTDQDLLLILIITCISLAFIMILGQNAVLGVADGWPLLLKTIYTVFIQFSIAGLGLSVVMLFRKEKFSAFGLKRKNLFYSLLLGLACVMAFIVLDILNKGNIDYLPFKKVNLTDELLKAGLPTGIIGMAFVVLAWGFFEGFNYVYISKKLNQSIPIKNPFLRMGPILMGIACIFIHGAVGHEMLSMLGSFLIVYITLMIPELTGNAWGCILVFVFYWNAI